MMLKQRNILYNMMVAIKKEFLKSLKWLIDLVMYKFNKQFLTKWIYLCCLLFCIDEYNAFYITIIKHMMYSN